MLRIEIHDDEVGNSLCARIGRDGTITYDYQAEMWVQQTADDFRGKRVRWALLDSQGIRALWATSPDPSERLPRLVKVTPRFTGEWTPDPGAMVDVIESPGVPDPKAW